MIIPRNNRPDTTSTVVPKQHWSKSFATLIYYGKERPKDPPYLFDCAKSNMIPKRRSTNDLSDAKNILPD